MNIIQIRSLQQLNAIEKGIIIAPNRCFGNILIETLVPPDIQMRWKNRANEYYDDNECFALRINKKEFQGEYSLHYDRSSFYFRTYEGNWRDYPVYMMNYAFKRIQCCGGKYHTRYREGDFVKISDKLKAHNFYDNGLYCTREMAFKKGHVGIISKAYRNTWGELRYSLKGDYFPWSPSMIDDVILVGTDKPEEIPYTSDCLG